jgi:hypothetical protein
MYPTPPPAWYASGLRWIASGIASFADYVDRRAPEPWPLDTTPAYRCGEEVLHEARHRAQRGL